MIGAAIVAHVCRPSLTSRHGRREWRRVVPQDSLAAGASQPPVAPPGTKWFYSNYGYDLLTRVVEVVTGQDVGTVLQQRILGPLGLHRTLLPTSGNGLSVPFAHGYVAASANATTQSPVVASDDVTNFATSCVWASGALVSTLSDKHLWSQALGTGALLKPAVWKQAQQGMIPSTSPTITSGQAAGAKDWGSSSRVGS
jgi:D-alanyl-D-alanine carboxypeptidase